jgi:hypothetical protein
MPKLMVAQHGDILILAQGNEHLDGAEFQPIEQAFVNAFRQNNYRIRMVSFSDRAMDAAQRKRTLNAGWDRKTSHAVVVTRDVLTRSSVTALSWFGVPVRSASPSQYRSVLSSYLRFTKDELAMTEITLKQLRRGLSGEAPTIDAILKGQFTREFRASE